ncbi:MAG TPA: Hsp70 family protein, partial [Thermoanaerobaculia bacterium]
MSKILGIDLGTTNSCAAIVEATVSVVLANREGSRTTASIVAFSEEGDRLVGQIAKRQAITNPQNTVYAVKRLIGRKFREPQVERARGVLPYTLAEAVNGDVKIEIRDRHYSPEEISALVLREIKEFVEEQLQEEVREAVITVPAYFNDSQRLATKDAGKIAGLDVVRILNEPTAAALAYGLHQRNRELRAVVLDLGGGTFDVTVLEIIEGVIEIQASAG